jgi:hypothetical protein
MVKSCHDCPYADITVWYTVPITKSVCCPYELGIYYNNINSVTEYDKTRHPNCPLIECEEEEK